MTYDLVSRHFVLEGGRERTLGTSLISPLALDITCAKYVTLIGQRLVSQFVLDRRAGRISRAA